MPSGWKYDLITNICSKIVDGDHNPPVAQKQISPYIMLSSKNINEDAITNLNDVRYLSKADFDISNNRTKVTKGDVLFTSVGSIGRTCIYDLVVPIAFQRSVTVMTTYIYNRYFKLFLDSPLYQNYVFENARGTAQKGFYINQIENSLIPIPPYNEQIKIVEITEKLLFFVKKIEEERNNIIENIYRIKSEILDLAISGKLVPQNSADEPAIELLRKINPAFKPCDNSHYEKLPASWQEIEMGEICKLCDGDKISDKPMTYIDVKYLRCAKEGEIVSNGKFISKNSTLILVDGENSGEVFTTPIDGYQGSTFKILNISEHLCKDYVLLLIKRCQKLLRENKVGSAIPHLNKKMFKELTVPIPPLSEQRKIVETVNDIFSKLENITAEL